MTTHEMTILIARAEGVMMTLYGLCRDLVIGCSVDEDKYGKLGDVISDAANGLMQVYNSLELSEKKPTDIDHDIDRVVSAIVEYGQKDSQFSLGETIKYSPSEIGKILKKAVGNESK